MLEGNVGQEELHHVPGQDRGLVELDGTDHRPNLPAIQLQFRQAVQDLTARESKAED